MVDLLQKAAPFIPIVEEASRQYGVPADLLLGQLAAESKFNPVAVSGAGAKGIAQFMDETAKQYGVNQFDPKSSIMGQAKFMGELLKQFNGNEDLAIAAYNAGPGNVKKYGGIPPFKETQAYVPRVQDYRKLFAGGQPSVTPTMLPNPSQLDVNQPQINPASLLPQQQPTLSKGMQTLLTVLASIGSLGGTAANVIGGIKGSGSPGNAAINQSSGLFGMLAQQRENQQQNQDRASLVEALSSNPRLAALAAAGGRPAVAQALAQKPEDALSRYEKILTIKKAEQSLQAGTPEGIKAAAEAKAQAETQDKFTKSQQLANLDAIPKDQRTNEQSIQRAMLQKELGVKPDDIQALEKANGLATLRNRYATLQSIKDLSTIDVETQKINELYQQYKAGAMGDLKAKGILDNTLITLYNKTTDPQSVVRESEAERTQEASGLADRVKNYPKKFQEGALLTEQQREDIHTIANLFLQQEIKRNRGTLKQAYMDAKDIGVSVDAIIPISESVKGFHIKNELTDTTEKINQSVLEKISPEDLKKMSKEELQGLL